MRLLLSVLFATCAFQLCFAQSEVTKHQLGIGAFYFLSAMSAPAGEETMNEAIVPFGGEIFFSYQIHKRWRLEAGFDFRSRKNTPPGYCGNIDVNHLVYNFTTRYLDLPVKADFHILGKRKFNFDLLFGLKGTWRYYDTYPDLQRPYSVYSFNTAYTYGLKESFRISPRIKINSEELINHYFIGNLKGSRGVDLKLGLEYLFPNK
ncbi:MAG TPA: hypothetical protein VE978_04700 [Chitinophagales bacterium]|nr:hypothetical protein [Chitinophagales bacterium]